MQKKKKNNTQFKNDQNRQQKYTHLYRSYIKKHKWNIENIFLNHHQLQYT